MSQVLTLGTFDLFHRGHVRLLARAADLGTVTVALNTDRFITRYKGQPPVMTYKERLEVVAACRHVQHVVANSDNGNSQGIIKTCRPRYIVIGDDWLERDYLAQLQVDREFLAKEDVSIVFVPYTGGVSTSEVRQRCLSLGSRSSAPSTDATKTPARLSSVSTPNPLGDLTKRGSSEKPEATRESYAQLRDGSRIHLPA